MTDILHILRLTPPVLLARQQVGGTGYRCQRGTQVMGDGEHHVLLGLEEFPVLPVGRLQLFLVAVFSIYVPVYDGIEHDCQQGNTQCKTGHGTVGRVTVKNECLIFRCEPCICFLFELGNERVHFPVQFRIVPIQAIHLDGQVCFPPFLFLNDPVVQGEQHASCGHNRGRGGLLFLLPFYLFFLLQVSGLFLFTPEYIPEIPFFGNRSIWIGDFRF
ncbi:hypothetical protein ACMSD2_02470 [Bacteroides thetaiotaomicron]|uniref:hypothetical protein n=1 Tax=Bacteroidaceae TaxID=815 RepID=UPI001CCEBE59|nr:MULTISPECIES: hypothetical protein [Bacteroidaceae]MCB7311010.1 hypothetical protein [Bacteroides thetaiotaomicron]MCG4874390.1 hypothetical protein [Bacteroides thetaiotaomicron]MCS2360283.1 hypothetical protein [Bacteroides thetaiotaomicron]MCS3230572.1 hypothetical protein [Bacteroides thetaiotaomicron]MDC2213282.1 hypothetical protein [Bacteroides thetaiotaomicron]